MSKKIVLRCRTPTGQLKLDNIDSELKFLDLKVLLESQTKIPLKNLKVKVGYPPKAIEKGNDDKKLSDLKISNGESLIIEESSEIEVDTPKKPTPEQYSKIPPRPSDITSSFDFGSVVKRSIPADNSCLFNAVAYTLEGCKSRKNGRAPYLRQVISDIVQFDKETYNSVYLDQSPADYCRWILKNDTWGGAIEIMILSDFYEIEICAFDVKSTKMYCYGEDKKYKTRIYLLYNGIHYDAFALTFDENAGEDSDITLFSSKDKYVEQLAHQCVKKAKERHEYTDTSDFKLVCMDCNKGLVGQKEAIDHCQKTGHTNFTENK